MKEFRQYLHVVDRDDAGNEIKRRVSTIVVLYDEESDLVSVGYAYCSDKDQFDKKLGVGKARGRALWGQNNCDHISYGGTLLSKSYAGSPVKRRHSVRPILGRWAYGNGINYAHEDESDAARFLRWARKGHSPNRGCCELTGSDHV